MFSEHKAYSTWRDCPTEIRNHSYISFGTSFNRVRTHVLVAPRGTKMLTETRDVLSLAPYVANTTSCVIAQDGIDLIAQVLENKAVVALLNGLLLHCCYIALRDIAFVISTKLSPSWRLSFRLVTNQLSLNTQKFQFLTLDHNNCNRGTTDGRH